MHRTTLGDFELTVVSDGTYFLDGGAFFGVFRRQCGRRKSCPMRRNRIDTGLNSLLVRTGDKNILIETGIGNKLRRRWRRSTSSRPSCSRTSTPPESPRKTSTSSSTPSPFRSLRMEHGSARRSIRGDVSESEVLRTAARMGAWPPATRARRRQLHESELRSTARKRPDGTPEWRSGDRARHLSQGFSPGTPRTCKR